MKPLQTLWTLFFLFSPSVYIGIEYGLWKGITALGICALLGFIFGWIAVIAVPVKGMKAWAFLKGPVIAGIVIFGFHYYFK